MRIPLIILLLAISTAACDLNENNNVESEPAAAVKAKATFRAISGDDVLAMIAPAGMQGDTFPAAAQKECADREFCKIVAWTNEADAATSFPMTDREVQTQAFQYTHNRVTGYEQRLWDCSRYPRQDTQECFSTIE